MARTLYGSDPSAVTVDETGKPVEGVVLTVWTARTGGSQLSDLLDGASSPAANVISGDNGLVVFYGPDGVADTLWLDSGSAPRLAVSPADIVAEIEAAVSTADGHVTATDNPHAVTKTQVGLGNVDNTSDASKPVSTATQAALDAKTAGPASSTDNALARFDGTTGKSLQSSGVTVDDAGTLTAPAAVVNSYPVVRGISALNGNIPKMSGSDGLVPSGLSSVSGQVRLNNFALHLGVDANSPAVLSGTGSPEGVHSAPVGSTYIREDGDTLGDIEYRKMSGSGNTGWVPGPACDTGWRDLTGETLANGWVSSNGRCHLRRIGMLVYFAASLRSHDATGESLYTLPVGFRTSTAWASAYSAGGVKRLDLSSSIGIDGYADQTYFVNESFTVATNNTAWPTTLPGTAD